MSEELDENMPQEDVEGIVNELVVEEEGNLMESQTINIQKLKDLGVVSISNFMTGQEDSFMGNDFDNSDPDYIKGYKYEQTGKF